MGNTMRGIWVSTFHSSWAEPYVAIADDKSQGHKKRTGTAYRTQAITVNGGEKCGDVMPRLGIGLGGK